MRCFHVVNPHEVKHEKSNKNTKGHLREADASLSAHGYHPQQHKHANLLDKPVRSPHTK
jgi:hypothetical protein